MSGKAAGGTRWIAVVSGWAVATLTGGVISVAFRLLSGLFLEPPVERGELTATLVVISTASGFLSYLVGGYVAARTARCSGGKHGALTAIFGLIVGIVLALFGVVFAEGVAVPPATFGLAAPVVDLVLFLTNLFGSFVGGVLGEPSRPDAKRPR